MKTKLEIIDETINYYSNPNNRGITGNMCKYLTDNGKMCAVGRCMAKPHTSYLGAASRILIRDGTQELKLELEPLLKEEYRGHSVKFWNDLQHLHDRAQHFTYTGFSHKGIEFIDELKAAYAQD